MILTSEDVTGGLFHRHLQEEETGHQYKGFNAEEMSRSV